jgi:hypothetical protein
VAESVGDLFVGAPGLRKRHHGLHPEKPWSGAEGRGFDSRQLHSGVSANMRPPCSRNNWTWQKCQADADSLLKQSRTGEGRCGSAAFGGCRAGSATSVFGAAPAGAGQRGTHRGGRALEGGPTWCGCRRYGGRHVRNPPTYRRFGKRPISTPTASPRWTGKLMTALQERTRENARRADQSLCGPLANSGGARLAPGAPIPSASERARGSRQIRILARGSARRSDDDHALTGQMRPTGHCAS